MGGARLRPPGDKGAGLGLATGSGGLCVVDVAVSVLGFAGDAGRYRSIAQGAVSLAIGAATSSGASLSDVCACVGLAVRNRGLLDLFEPLFSLGLASEAGKR